MPDMLSAASWPALSYDQDRGTFETLHLWTQIVGKIRVALVPWVNHGWHVTLHLSARGLTTSLIDRPVPGFDLEFDFIEESLRLRTSSGETDALPLRPGSVASFYGDVSDMLERHGISTRIHGAPNEIPDAIPFAHDVRHRDFDPDTARRLWRALLMIDSVFKRFRTGFIGKCSPVHFLWGSFDLAVTRFSGRRAPEHPGGVPNLPDDVAREAYSHEVSSAGFWTGGPAAPYPLFYAYAYPEPDGFRDARDLPDGARFDSSLGEYVLPYDRVRGSREPAQALLDFLQKTYAAAAVAGGWDRKALESELGRPREVRHYKL